jgi:hypothetical protein
MKFNEDKLPCLSPSLIDALDEFASSNDFSDRKLNAFFENFGTHAIMKATFGGKFV